MSHYAKRLNACQRAEENLREAREALKEAGAYRAADAVRRALSSAEGAARNARAKWHREARAQKEAALVGAD